MTINPHYLGRRANTAVIAQTAQNSIVAMVTNGTKYIFQRERPKPPSIKYHKNERTILPHKITWWMIVCSEITTNVNKFNSSVEDFEYDKLAKACQKFSPCHIAQKYYYTNVFFFLAVYCNTRGKTQTKKQRHVILQTQKTVFEHISTPREDSSKCDAQRSVLTNFEVFGNVVKPCLECLIYLLTRNQH